MQINDEISQSVSLRRRALLNAFTESKGVERGKSMTQETYLFWYISRCHTYLDAVVSSVLVHHSDLFTDTVSNEIDILKKLFLYIRYIEVICFLKWNLYFWSVCIIHFVSFVVKSASSYLNNSKIYEKARLSPLRSLGIIISYFS